MPPRRVAWAGAELLQRYRLRRVLRGSLGMLAAVRRERLVEKAARAAEVIPGQYGLQRRTLRVQQRTLRIQERALARIEETLAVARETEGHAESLDRKTGPTTPVPSG